MAYLFSFNFIWIVFSTFTYFWWLNWLCISLWKSRLCRLWVSCFIIGKIVWGWPSLFSEYGTSAILSSWRLLKSFKLLSLYLSGLVEFSGFDMLPPGLRNYKFLKFLLFLPVSSANCFDFLFNYFWIIFVGYLNFCTIRVFSVWFEDIL